MNLSMMLLKLIPRMTAICKKLAGWPDFQENTADITRSHDLHLWDPQHSPADEHHRRRCDWLNAFSRALAENFSGLYYPYAGCCLLFARIQIPGWELYQNLNYFNTVCFCIL